MRLTLLSSILAFTGMVYSPAALAVVVTVPITNVIGFQEGDAPNPGDGSISRLADGSGLTLTDPDDITTWTHSTLWEAGWQGQNNNLTGNVGWVVFDLGLPTANLGNLYLWNVNETFVTDRGVKDFKLWYSLTPTVTPPGTSATAQSYNFSSGGWTQLGSLATLSQGTGAPSMTFSGVYDLSSISSARYLAVEAISIYGGLFRTGLAEAVVTVVPESSTYAVLAGLVVLGVVIRRRVRA